MKLAVRIFDNEEGGYTAVCPSLPGCCTRGHTREEARDKMDEAIRGYMAAINNFVPENLIQNLVEA
jgi:predicted RNase H-like HicB family nuclease